MRKLGKLTISPDKIMKNEELINLQGGYGDQTVRCWVGDVVACTLAYYTCDPASITELCLSDACPEFTQTSGNSVNCI